MLNDVNKIVLNLECCFLLLANKKQSKWKEKNEFRCKLIILQYFTRSKKYVLNTVFFFLKIRDLLSEKRFRYYKLFTNHTYHCVSIDNFYNQRDIWCRSWFYTQVLNKILYKDVYRLGYVDTMDCLKGENKKR